MRALKSVLVMAGSLKRANPEYVEDLVLIRWVWGCVLSVGRALMGRMTRVEGWPWPPLPPPLPSSQPPASPSLFLPPTSISVRAMRDSNVPKFLVEDARLFNAIVSDLFPGVEVPVQVWKGGHVWKGMHVWKCVF